MEKCRWSNEYAFSMEDMVGQVFSSVRNIDDGELVFENEKGKFVFYHEQDCCESVYIESVVGDLSDLEGSEILGAEEVDGESTFDADEYESVTWTFYKFRTVKGYVDVRWCGSSNGYYSESVDMKYVGVWDGELKS